MGAVSEARQLVGSVKLPDDDAKLKGLRYVGKLKEVPVEGDEVTWIEAGEHFGMAPMVADGQNSPIVGQTGYNQWKSAPVHARLAKRFTNEELARLVSPDARLRMDAKAHIGKEIKDSQRRIKFTKEYVAHCAVARGAFKFVSNDPQTRMNLNLTFPIKTKTAGTLWSDAANATPVDDIQSWLDELELAGNEFPSIMRLSKKVWDNLKATTQFKAQFTSYLRTQGMDVGDVPKGLLTPEMAAKALGWPMIEIYSKRNALKFTAANAETAASNVTIELLGQGGLGDTFGLNVGDKLLIGYDEQASSWDEETVVETVTDGVSVVADISNDIAAGATIVARPTMHPENMVTFIVDESDMSFLQPSYGIEVSGNTIRPAAFRGLTSTVFTSGEPGLVVYRRVWEAFGFKFDPRKVLSATVL